jgi:hypothetical protein
MRMKVQTQIPQPFNANCQQVRQASRAVDMAFREIEPIRPAITNDSGATDLDLGATRKVQVVTKPLSAALCSLRMLMKVVDGVASVCFYL